MNLKNVIEFVNQLIEQHRVEIEERPEVTPIKWEGIGMTVNEARLVIQKLEDKKVQYQKAINSTQAGGEITRLAAGGAGMTAIVTGAALVLFPPTAIAGIITLVSGIGAVGVGKAVGDGIREIGTNSNTQAIEQIDAYINSIKNAIIASI
jgi:hypothetical protein